jgi:hypothetical protein
MAHQFSKIMFTDSIKKLQERSTRSACGFVAPRYIPR